MKIIDLKYQSVTPGNPSPNTLGVFADSGTAGVVYTLISGGVREQIGIRYTGSIPSVNVATGQGTLETGFWFGSTGVGATRATGLSTPFRFLPVLDSNGATLAIPAYMISN